MNRGSQNVAIIRIGQSQGGDQGQVTRHKATPDPIHHRSRAFQFSRFDILAIVAKISDPLLVNLVRPSTLTDSSIS